MLPNEELDDRILKVLGQTPVSLSSLLRLVGYAGKSSSDDEGYQLSRRLQYLKAAGKIVLNDKRLWEVVK